MKTFEQLESRLMPCTPLDVLSIINVVNTGQYSEQADINQDGMVSPLDALLAINEANRMAAGNPQPMVIHPRPGGNTSLWFSPCGNEYDLTLLARNSVNPDAVSVRIGTDVFQPTDIDTFGDYQRWEFSVAGRGTELLSVLGEFDDDILTLIIG